MFGVYACGLWDLNVFCENLRLITLRSRLEVCEKESSILFPVALRRPPRLRVNPRPLMNPRPGVRMFSSRRRRVSRQSLPFSPSLTRACSSHSPVEFTQDYLFPSQRARDTVSIGIDDVLLTAASDSKDFGPSLADVLPLSGQEARPSPAYSELVDVLSRATEKLALDWPDEPRESRSSKLDERFLSGVNSKMSGGSCRISVICIRRSPDPGNGPFLPTLLTRRPLTSPTSWVRWSRAIPPCPLWRLRGCPAPSFRLNRVGLLPL